jgi:hypothetical protein
MNRMDTRMEEKVKTRKRTKVPIGAKVSVPKDFFEDAKNQDKYTGTVTDELPGCLYRVKFDLDGKSCTVEKDELTIEEQPPPVKKGFGLIAEALCTPPVDECDFDMDTDYEPTPLLKDLDQTGICFHNTFSVFKPIFYLTDVYFDRLVRL